eukprot:Skav222005  [mRNA]  locus=scaffold2020:121069:130280:- [translate_table: standard]
MSACSGQVEVDVEHLVDTVIFVCDGRFHLESAMIQNPHVQGNFFRYDPACLTLTREGFAHHELHVQRKAAIAAAKDARLVGLVLGTLGRQGSVGVLEEIERLLQQRGVAHFTILLSEISPERLALIIVSLKASCCNGLLKQFSCTAEELRISLI